MVQSAKCITHAKSILLFIKQVSPCVAAHSNYQLSHYFPALLLLPACISQKCRMGEKQSKRTSLRSRLKLSGLFSHRSTQAIDNAPQLSQDDATVLLDGRTEDNGAANTEETSHTTATAPEIARQGNEATSVDEIEIERNEQPGGIIANTGVHSDVWSKAYQEALKKMGDNIDVAMLASKNAERMLEDLGELCTEAGEKSAAMKGIAKLKSIKPALEKLKFVVEVASPLGDIHPAASTALGVVKSVITVSFTTIVPPEDPKAILKHTILN